MNTAIDNIDLSGYQTIANISQTLNDLSDEQKAQKYPSVAAVLEAIAGLDLGLTSDQVKDLQDLLQSDGIISQVSSLRGDIDKLNGTGEGSVEKSIVDALGDLGTGNTTVADALADKADTSAVDANTAAITKLNGDETVNGSVANTVKGMTVPKPTIDCGAGKMCVLSIGTDGNPVWIDVTQPYGE